MADYDYITAAGVVLTDTADLRATVEAEWREAFGADLAVNPELPQGVMITAETLARSKVLSNNAALANQINPNIAGGVFLKALCVLTGFEAPAATYSVLRNVALTGVATRIIPASSQAATAAGDVFESLSDVTLDAGGLGTVDFQAIAEGPTPGAANTLTTIITPVLGWETVNNPTAAELGEAEISDESLRRLRDQTLALQGASTAAAVESALSDPVAVPGFRSKQFRENVASAPATIDGIDLVAHSVWACVDGGTDLAVATALLEAKGAGADWNGLVSVDVVDPASGQTYSVLFDRPTAVPVMVKATVRSPSSTTDPTTSVKAAVLAYAAGQLSGMDGFTVGASVSPFEISGAITSQIPGIYVRKLEVKKVTDVGYVTVEIPLALDELATLTAANILVDLVT